MQPCREAELAEQRLHRVAVSVEGFLALRKEDVKRRLGTGLRELIDLILCECLLKSLRLRVGEGEANLAGQVL